MLVVSCSNIIVIPRMVFSRLEEPMFLPSGGLNHISGCDKGYGLA